MEPLQGRARLPSEVVQARFVHEHDVGSRDHIAEAPAQLAEVPRSDRVYCEGIVQALPSEHPFVPGLRGRVDGDDHERLAERLSEHLELRPAAQAIDEDALSVDSWHRALGPDSESVSLSFGVGHAPDRRIGDGQATSLGFLAHYVAHPDDREADVFRHDEDFFLAAAGHAGDADDLHAARKWKAGLRVSRGTTGRHCGNPVGVPHLIHYRGSSSNIPDRFWDATGARSTAGLVLFVVVLLGVAPWFSGFASAGRPTVAPRVLIVIFNPIIEAQGNQRLVELMGWSDPDSLSQEYAQALHESSAGYVEYQVVGRIEIDGYPAKDNGHVFTDEEYLECLTPSHGLNCARIMDYLGFLESYGICSFANERKVTELWLWGGPWFGYWEAVQAGRDPISTNGPPILGTTCKRTLDIMGFNYERGLAEMLEDFAHRAEGDMEHVYGHRLPDETTPWNRFTLLDRDVPGRGGCGTAHLAVNAAPGAEYDRENPTTVPSSCPDFLNYPDLTGTFVDINCSAWGCTTVGYLEWWLHHIPRTTGRTDGKLNNWWAYIVHVH